MVPGILSSKLLELKMQIMSNLLIKCINQVCYFLGGVSDQRSLVVIECRGFDNLYLLLACSGHLNLCFKSAENIKKVSISVR